MIFFFTVETGDMTQILASCADNVRIKSELFQARLYSLYLVTEYLVDKP